VRHLLPRHTCEGSIPVPAPNLDGIRNWGCFDSGHEGWVRHLLPCHTCEGSIPVPAPNLDGIRNWVCSDSGAAVNLGLLRPWSRAKPGAAPTLGLRETWDQARACARTGAVRDLCDLWGCVRTEARHISGFANYGAAPHLGRRHFWSGTQPGPASVLATSQGQLRSCHGQLVFGSPAFDKRTEDLR